MVPPKKPEPEHLTDSERAALDEWRAERDFERKLAERSKARRESVKVWTQWAATVVGLLVFGKEAIVWAAASLKAWLLGP